MYPFNTAKHMHKTLNNQQWLLLSGVPVLVIDQLPEQQESNESL